MSARAALAMTVLALCGCGALFPEVVAEMDRIDIDPDARTAWAGSGVTAGAYTEAAQEYGLATGFGDTASVGLGGLITGGGIGPAAGASVKYPAK